MAQSWNGWCAQLGLVSSLAIGGASAFSRDCTLAQPTPDDTLGAERSVVTPNVVINGIPSDQINGGAIRGTNLFHSFLEFNVGEGRGAYFTNPTGIANIITRVTGGNPSNILGALGVSGGNANLFLINPNGIIFGPNARLDVRGSFVASTASSLNFADGTQFSATESQITPLLTVNVPIGLQFGGGMGSPLGNSGPPLGIRGRGGNAGRIVVQGQGQGIRLTTEPIDTSVGLRVQPDQTLALVGGDVALEGGTLKTAGGRIELGSVADPSLVSLTPTDKGWSLAYEGVQNFRDIQLSQQAVVDVSGAGGGDIQVQGRRVTLTDGSQIEASTLRSEPGGTLAVTAQESVEVTGISVNGNPSALTALVYEGATGAGGSLTLETGRLSVRGGALIGTRTDGTKPGGTLAVTASESVELVGYRSRLFTQTGGAGDAGNLTIATRRLSVRDGAQVSASTSRGSEGRGRNLAVTASESVELIGIGTSQNGQVSIPSGLFTRTQGAGDAGNLTIATRRLSIRDGAQVSASTLEEGQGGNLVVTAPSEFVEVMGMSPNGNPSGLFTQTQGTGNAGNLTVATGQLSVRDGAEVSVSSVGEGSGEAGNLEVAARSIQLDNKGKLIAETESGQGGNITLQDLDLLLMRHNSEVSTNAGTAEAGGDGGNIDIDSKLIVAVPQEDSDITANAFRGKGGRVQIAAQGIFGTQFREKPTPQSSDITASSDFGVNGVVKINTPDIDPSRGLVALPAELVDVTGLIAQGCPAGGGNVGRGSSKFIVTGRGGLPSQPGEALRTSAVVVNGGTLKTGVENRSREVTSTPVTRSTPAQLVEAQGWVLNAQGQVVLTAQAPTVTLNSSWLTPPQCHAS